MKKQIALAILLLHALASPAFSDEIRKISLPKDAVTIQHKVFNTDIFWEIIPWNDGSSLTVDGWGRYSVLSFDKKGMLRQEFNADGKCIHTKSSDGTELFFEYDSNGNEIYFKSSDGRERRTVYEYYSNGKIKEAKIFE